MYKLTFEKIVWIVKHYLDGEMTSRIALTQKISNRTVQNLVKIKNCLLLHQIDNLLQKI